MCNTNSKSLSLSSLIKMCGAVLVAGATTMIHGATLPQPVSLRAPSLSRAVVGSFAPQQTNLEKRIKGGKPSGNSSGGNAPAGSTDSPTQPAKDKSRGTSSGRGNRPPRVSKQLPITFLTDAPRTQVFVSGRSIGLSDNDARLFVYLKRGTYTVATKQQNGSTTPAQSITIAPGKTIFSLSAKSNAMVKHGAKEGTASGNADNAAAINTGAKEGAGSGDTDNAGAMLNPEAKEGTGVNNAEEILERYSDPKQTGSVTESDWQRVLSMSNANLAQEPTSARFKAQAFFAQGQLAFIRGDFAGARSAFNSAALTLPDSQLAFYGLGNAYLATNQPAEAYRAYLRAIELNGEFALAHKGMGDALTKQGKNKEALARYERARELGYSSSDTSYNTALNLMKRKRWDAALKELNELAKTKPSAGIYQSIGDCYLGLKKPLSAAQSYRKATELDPKSALAAYKYGNIMYALNEYEAAAEAFERALVLDQTGDIIERSRARKMANEAAKRANKAK